MSNKYKAEIHTAILVDGGFYRKRAKLKTPKETADELEYYCHRHLNGNEHENRCLYRIFYYDCSPVEKGKHVYHPLLKRNIKLGDSDIGEWMREFLSELKHRRKFALRLGHLSDVGVHYNLRPEVTKNLLDGKISLDDLKENDFRITLSQKGVDMRIGVDIASMAFKKQVQQIILIAGDSDFVPAAKLARREGIDFILDPMGNHIPADLFEHIDGIYSPKMRSTAK